MPDKNPQAVSVAETQQEPWTLFTDGSSCVDGFGAGLILTNPEGIEFTYALRFQFAASNNEAEYEALIASLRIAAQMGVQNVHVSVDSKLVANQVLGTYKKADALSKIASTSFAHLSKQVLVEVLKNKSIKEKEVTTVVEEDEPTWMTPIVEYLKEGTLLSDRKEARKLCIKARQYELIEGILYRRSFLTPWLRCVGPLQAEYGIDIAGPFPEGPGKVKYLIVVIDYFTKWIEAKAVATITGGQSNGLLERANRSLGEGIKARVGEGNKNWLEELPLILWSHRTMIKSSYGDTPFSLTYETKAVIPAEIGMPTYRTAAVDIVSNDKELRLNLDLLEERRERAAIYEAKAKLKMIKYYNARVCDVTFRPGDFIYCNNDASHAVVGGKLGPKWKGPYEVTEALGDGAYKLRSMDGTIIPILKDVTSESRLTHGFHIQLGLANNVNHDSETLWSMVGTNTSTPSDLTYSMGRPDPLTIMGFLASIGLRPTISAASCAGRYEKPKGYLAYKKKPINNNSGKEYYNTRITPSSGCNVHPNFCINRHLVSLLPVEEGVEF
nr:reverse transcriptase domain-containing protein [Tanacetum cinerariifolium]